MDWGLVLTVSLAYAAGFCGLFTVLIVGGVLVARDAMVPDYPPAIRERYGKQSRRGAIVNRLMSIGMLALLVGLPMLGMWDLHRRAGDDLGFLPGFVFGTLLFAGLTAFDLVVIDWWLFCNVQPRFLVLPGTEGMAEYRDYAFHWKVLVPGPLLVIPAYGVAVGGLTALAELLW